MDRMHRVPVEEISVAVERAWAHGEPVERSDLLEVHNSNEVQWDAHGAARLPSTRLLGCIGYRPPVYGR